MAHWIEELFSTVVIAPLGAGWPFVVGGLVVVVLVLVDARRLRRRRRHRRAAPPPIDGRITIDLSKRR